MLDRCERSNARRTYLFDLENIGRFAERSPQSLTLGELKPFRVTDALSDFPPWGNDAEHDVIGSVMRGIDRAVDAERIERNPLARIRKPSREARETAASPGESAALIKAAGCRS